MSLLSGLGTLIGAGGLGSFLSGGASLLGGLFGDGGLFGAEKKDPTPASNLLSQAQGAREAAAKYGFNPLTMLQYGQTGGAMTSGGGAPPLASIDLISGGLRDLGDVFSGDLARKRAADQLQLDLAQLKLDQLRSGVIAAAPSAADAAGRGDALFGRRQARIVDPGAGFTRPIEGGFNVNLAAKGDNLALPRGRVPVPGDGGDIDRGRGIFVGGRFIEPTPGWSSAQVAEDEYGDVAGSIYGPVKAYRDIVHTLGRVFTSAEVEAARERGVPVYRMSDGKYYAPMADVEKLPPFNQIERLEGVNAPYGGRKPGHHLAMRDGKWIWVKDKEKP